MKITTKGQVTIPQEIRDELDLRPGTDVEFAAEGDHAVLRKRDRKPKPVEAWLKQATGVAKGRCTTDEIMKLTRGR